jgi:hypothetical protein
MRLAPYHIPTFLLGGRVLRGTYRSGPIRMGKWMDNWDSGVLVGWVFVEEARLIRC